MKIEDKKLKIVKFSKVNQNDLYEFYHRAFCLRHKIIFKNRNWLYGVRFFGYEPLLLLLNNKIIGHAGMISNNILKDNKKYKCTWCVDFKILPEYRNKGLGTKLSAEWMKVSPHHLAITNNESPKVFKKLGWLEKTDYKRAANILNPLKWIPIMKNLDNKILEKINFYKYIKSFNVKKIKPFKLKENLSSFKKNFLLNEKIFNKNISICRDEEWFNWRIIDSPFIDNYYFFSKENSFILVHLLNMNKIKRINILYSSCTDLKSEIDLSQQLINWGIENNMDLIWLNHDGLEYREKIKKIFKNTKKISFLCNSNEKFLKKIEISKISNIQAIDTDSDIIYST